MSLINSLYMAYLAGRRNVFQLLRLWLHAVPSVVGITPLVALMRLLLLNIVGAFVFSQTLQRFQLS
jgi:hypothetical protein